MLRIDQLKLPVTHDEEALLKKINKTINLKRYHIKGEVPRYSYRILRRSLDARRKPELFYVYSLAISLDRDIEKQIIRNYRGKDISEYVPKEYKIPKPSGVYGMHGRPVITGTGPAGLFCAYLLCMCGYSPILLERGEPVDIRKKTVEDFWNGGELNSDSNVQFGEGGAGTFSDGKLNTLVNDKEGRNQFVLNTFVRFGAPVEIRYESKPHIGTDILIDIVKNMREFIISHGGTFMFSTRLEDFETDENGISAVSATRLYPDGSRETISITTNCLILAIGHSARDTYMMLQKNGVSMSQKNFAVGLRIEHPQTMINECQYGKNYDKSLPPADYKLTNRTKNGRNVYSFCMCPGGFVVNASSEKDRLTVNGMSYSQRDSLNANSAIIVSVDRNDFRSDDVLAGIDYVRDLEQKAFELAQGAVPVQQYADFKNNTLSKDIGAVKPQIKGSFKQANLRKLFSEDINNAIIESIDKFGYTMEGFDRADALLSGVESRTSSPVRINREKDHTGSIKGLYPCGEGAGYAGGITSAAMDGMKTAEAVMRYYSV